MPVGLKNYEGDGAGCAKPRAAGRGRYGTYRRRTIFPWELPSIMRKHIFTGAMGNVYVMLTSGIFFTAYARELGVTYFQFGVLSAGCSLALVFQLISAYGTGRVWNRKILWLVSLLLARGLRGVAFGASFLLFLHGSEWAPYSLICLIVLCNLAGSISMPPWMSWLADIIPEYTHATFMGRRQAWICFSVGGSVLAAALLMDRVGVGVLSVWTKLSFIFFFAVFMGFLDLVIHRTIPEPFMAVEPRGRFLAQVFGVLRDLRFRKWLRFTCFWNFGMRITVPFFMVYFVEDLGLGKNFLGGVLVTRLLPTISGMFLSHKMGKWIDRVGTRRALLVCHLLWATLPFIWIWATPGTALPLIGLGAVIGGLASSGGMLAGNKLVTRVPPAADRAMYISVSSCVANLSGAAGAFLGGTLASWLHDCTFTVLGQTFVGVQLLFLLGSSLRAFSTVFLKDVPEPRKAQQ